MHLAVPGAIGNFYDMQVALTHTQAEKRPAANLSAQFHQDIKFWSNLCAEMTDSPTYCAELVHRLTSDHEYTKVLGLGAGGYGIDGN